MGVVMQSTNAIVHFWDHSEVSPGVHVYGVTQDILRGIIVAALPRLAESKSPAVQAGSFVICIADTPGEYELGLVNAPLGFSVGNTLGRMQSPNNAPGGLGLLLIDVGGNELQTFGGPGLLDEDFNQWQVRITALSDLVPAPAPPPSRKKKTARVRKQPLRPAAPFHSIEEEKPTEEEREEELSLSAEEL